MTSSSSAPNTSISLLPRSATSSPKFPECAMCLQKDLWDADQSAHAQIIDLQTGKEAATHVGTLLLTASLSTAINLAY